MSEIFDAIIVGLGGMGSAAAYHLAARGKRVLGLEQYTSPHDRGSSHGASRVIRQAYFEDPAYVPLLLRAYGLWRQIERETNTSLLTETGGLMIGPPDCEVVTGSLRSAKEYGLEYEILDAKEIKRRFPPMQPDHNTVALYEKRAGFLRPEESVKAHLDRAEGLGATLHFEEEVLAWEAFPDRVCVRTANGNYEGEHLIIAPGAWAPQILSDLNLPLQIERQVMYWFDPIGGIEPFLPDCFPIFIWEADSGVMPYGLPALEGPNGGVKVAIYHSPFLQTCTPQTIDRTVHEHEVELMRSAIAHRIPSLNGALLKAVTCMYTKTPDQNFIIAAHPQHPQVVIACGFSGHGFKFCSVVGEILADLVDGGETRHDIRLFSPMRFVVA